MRKSLAIAAVLGAALGVVPSVHAYKVPTTPQPPDVIIKDDVRVPYVMPVTVMLPGGSSFVVGLVIGAA